MNFFYKTLIISALSAIAWPQTARAQSVNCTTNTNQISLVGEVFFNYGSISNSFNSTTRSSYTIGQPFVGESFDPDYSMLFGFWSRFLLPPSAPAVFATEGDLPDRIQISWTPDPLSPAASDGYNLYRDGALLATMDAQTRAFVDFNVLAGQFYTYTVAGKSPFGQGLKGSALGFLNPNGVATGQVKTLNDNPVPDCIVTLSPTIGTAVEFTGDDKIFAETTPLFNVPEWSVSCWVKLGAGNDEAGIIDLGSSISQNWWIQTTAAADGKGVKIGVGAGGGNSASLQKVFAPASADDWHYVAMTYNGTSVLLYLDGEFVGTTVAPCSRFDRPLYFGRRTDEAGNFNGKLDDVRVYSRQLSQTELQMGMNRTVSSTATGLVSYWKFDEGTGSKGFDIGPNKIKTYLCGPTWTTDKPAVQNAGMTDATGFFKIDGINYGAGQTFTATAEKTFYFNQSLEFNASNEQYAELTDFDLPDTSTLTFTVKPFDLSGQQTILSKQGAGGAAQFTAFLDNGILKIRLGDDTHSFGAMAAGFHHVAMTMSLNGAAVDATVYVDGALNSTVVFTGVPANISGNTRWTLGGFRSSGNDPDDDFFTGLIDEVAVFDKELPLPKIQLFANDGTDVSHPDLLHYFNLNEGIGDTIMDMGRALTGKGSIHGASWSTSAAVEKTAAHEFNPSSRLVTLNPSNTSSDGLSFTDESTVPISGYVRFDGTDCFVAGAEVLVNGASHTPPIMTDADGYFVGDFEPGSKLRLKPVFKNHSFTPMFWDIPAAVTPVAGILFRDQTKRKVIGQIAGGSCRKSIIAGDDHVRIKVETLNGCYYREQEITAANGKFTFNNLPPTTVAVAITNHDNGTIETYFMDQGGEQLNLEEKNDTIDFIWFAPPEVEVSALDTNSCGDAMLERGAQPTVNIRVFEDYLGGKCYLDSALLRISNDIAEKPQFDTMMTAGIFKYKFRVGKPNIVSPYLKTLQVVAFSANGQDAKSSQAVVLGERERVSQFVTTKPNVPLLILRDPPGDASSAYMEKGTTKCTTFSVDVTETDGTGGAGRLSLGPNFEAKFFGIGVEYDVVVEVNTDFIISKTQTTNTSTDVCVTTTEVISTSDNDLIVGGEQGGDVYMGGALNLIFGKSDKLSFNPATCTFSLSVALAVAMDTFSTTYIYSEHYIKNELIPQLTLLNDQASVVQWNRIIADNQKQKDEATFVKNLSFDAGVVYELSETVDSTKGSSTVIDNSSDVNVQTQFGLFVSDVGLSFGHQSNIFRSNVETKGTANTNSTTTGFTLSDDDIGDNFTVDILKDKKYGTPVFKTKSGQSSCPWEPKTQNREEVAPIVANQTVAINVPENDQAVFSLVIGNISQSQDTREYLLSLIPESNPDGAVVKINGGGALDRPFGLPYAVGQNVTVTVERGPLLHDYEDLEFALFSECEDSRGVALGLDALDPKFYKSILLDVHFIEPCSRVDISNPAQDWVLTPADGVNLFVTLDDYDTGDADLELVRLQYRRTQGDGAWINITEILKADLGPIFETTEWNTTGLADGLYEIRAVAQCVGGLESGISHVIHGKIERTPPEIFGTPEPADGVWSPGDEISIQFTEPIRCDLLIQADFFDNNNVGLYDSETGNLIDATITCQGDKIIIVPNAPAYFLENKVLRVEVDDIEDLAGNPFIHAEWEFVADRNELQWIGSPVTVVKYEEEAVVEQRKIRNRGGVAIAWELTNLPTFANIFPTNGTLQPGAEEFITFEFDSSLVFGVFSDTIQLHGVHGDEPMPTRCRVVCHEPAWVFDAASFTYSQNFILKLDIEGTLSTDDEDLVAAFVGDELRGKTSIKFIPALNQHLAFLTVFSNTLTSVPINFRIWDASACLLYGTVVESFNFEADGIIGSLAVPTILHTNNLVLREIPLKSGWNWISFNLNLPNNSINAALASMKHPQGDFMKSQTQFSQFVTGPNSWIGSLPTVDFKPMYQLRATVKDTIKMLGNPMDPTSIPIPLTAGWNWIGYLPQSALTVNEALASLTPLNGDLLKSQFSFAQYLAGFGWIGNLSYMKPPEGYLLKLAAPGTLTYPHGNFTGETVNLRNDETVVFRDSVGPGWSVNPPNFESTMTVIGFLKDENGLDLTADGQVLGAFAGDELRGAATSLWIESLQKRLFFLTIYANGGGEPLKFKLFEPTTGETKKLNETEFFTADAALGMVETPKPFTFETSSPTDAPTVETVGFEVFPNPFTERVVIQFSMKKSETVRLVVTDALGRQVDEMPFDARPGLNALTWNGSSATGERLAAGVYVIRLETDGGSMNRKVIFQH